MPPKCTRDRKVRTRWLALAAIASTVGLATLPASPGFATEAPPPPPVAGFAAAPPPQVDLRIDPRAASRVLAAADEGASQESDPERPKAMSDQAAPRPVAATSAPRESRLAFLKEWAFWVVLGGVVVAGVATYALVKNANDKTPCGARYNSGCFGAQ